MSIQLYIFGSRGTYPSFGNEFKEYGKETSCYVIKENDYAIVLDCGSGLYNARNILGQCTKVDVLISHVHYDHIMGLYENRDLCTEDKFTYYGEFYQWQNAENRYKPLFPLRDYLSNNIISVKLDEKFHLNDGYTVEFTRSNHPDNSAMIKLEKNGYTICYTGDFEYDHEKSFINWARNVDVLLMDGMYTKEEKESFKGKGHSCWQDAVEIINKAGTKIVFIVHHDNKHTDKILFNEEKKAKALSDSIYFSKQGQIWTLR